MKGTTPRESTGLSRRAFLGASAAGTLAAFAGAARGEVASSTTKQAILPQRRLGKTGLMVPEVSFGSWNLSNPRLVEAAIDAGMTLIETSPGYQEGRAEQVIGQAIKPRRDEVVVGTGWHVDEQTETEPLLEQLEGSLRRLQTDRVELIRADDVTEPGHLDNERLYEAFEQAKQAGKARHLGVSVHSRNTEEAVLQKAIQKGQVSYVMAKYNFMEFPHIVEIFQRAAEAGVGVVVFKVGAGERQKEMDELRAAEKLTVKQAAIRWALNNPHVCSVLTTVTNFQQIREFSAAAGGALTTRQSHLLEQYRRQFDDRYCRYCGQCAPHCPMGVDVDAVMRYAMYHRYYAAPHEARRLYATLEAHRRAGACAGCAGPCQAACPYGLGVREQLVEAHQRLSGGLA